MEDKLFAKRLRIAFNSNCMVRAGRRSRVPKERGVSSRLRSSV